jgi:molybdopterin-guanine dinucleotide biosynthesis protein A
MAGRDKALCPVGGTRMIERVIARLGPQCAEMAINANGDPARFCEYGLPVLPDGTAEAAGPLAGVLAGLDWAASLGADTLVTAAVDSPFFPTDMVERLQRAAGARGLCLAASPDADGALRRHPTFGLWPVALRDDLRAALAGGLRKVSLWADGHGAATARFESHPFDPFFNINTPQDILTAEALIGAA